MYFSKIHTCLRFWELSKLRAVKVGRYDIPRPRDDAQNCRLYERPSADTELDC
jgi:hypothetical protein